MHLFVNNSFKLQKKKKKLAHELYKNKILWVWLVLVKSVALGRVKGDFRLFSFIWSLLFELFFLRECIPEMYVLKKVLLNKWMGKNLLQGNYSRNTCWINEWILNEWINVHMNKWMHRFTCFQFFCYALCGSKEVVCEILQLTEDHIRFAGPSYWLCIFRHY